MLLTWDCAILIGCSSLNSQDPCEGWQMYRQLEHYRVSPEFATEPTAAYACPTEQEGAARTAVALPAMASVAVASQGSQAAQNLSGHRRTHLCSSGLGPRVRHHRFPYAARSQVAFAFRAKSLSGPADSVSLRACPARCGAGIAPSRCIFSLLPLPRPRARCLLSSARIGCSLAGRMFCPSLGITPVEGEPPASGLVVSNHLSYLDIVIFAAAMPCFFVAKAEIGRWPYFGPTARLRRHHVHRSLQPVERGQGRERDRRAPSPFRFRSCFFPRAPAPTAVRYCAFTRTSSSPRCAPHLP